VDLHVHSLFSDGSDDLRSLVERASSMGLSLLSVTDHDVTSHQAEALSLSTSMGVRYLCGVEVSSEVESLGLGVHLLLYGFDPASPAIADMEGKLKAYRAERNAAMLLRLKEMGLPVEMEEVRSIAGKELFGRPHLAEAMVRKGYAGSRREAFERYLRRGAPAYVPRRKLKPLELSRVARESGALLFWAHPCLDVPHDLLEEVARRLREEGLDGIEAYSSYHDPLSVKRSLEVASRLGLSVSGGSDYHGLYKGVSMGVRVPAHLLEWALELSLKALSLEAGRASSPWSSGRRNR